MKQKNKKILVVDDNDNFRKSFIEYLKSLKGIEVVGEASDGLEALQKTSLLNPDIILMDFTMPKMDGITSARKIKKKYPKIEIIIVTIHDEYAYRDLISSLPVDGFVSKSSLTSDLVAILTNLVFDKRVPIDLI